MSRQSLLARLGLGRPELRAWAMYDWAASAVQTTIMVAVFPIYFVKVAGAGVGRRRRHPAAGDDQLDRAGDHRAGVAGAGRHLRLPRRQEEIHRRVHGAGPRRVLSGSSWSTPAISTWPPGSSSCSWWAWRAASCSTRRCSHTSPGRARSTGSPRPGTRSGYLGGGILLALNLAWIQMPGLFGLPSGPGLSESDATLPARLAFLSVAVWWPVFSIPLFRRVPEPPARIERDERTGREPGAGGLRPAAARPFTSSGATGRRS